MFSGGTWDTSVRGANSRCIDLSYGGVAKRILPVKRCGGRSWQDSLQHTVFHLKPPSASTTLGYGGSLRWTTWSSRSTISSHKIKKVWNSGHGTRQSPKLSFNKWIFSPNKAKPIILLKLEGRKTYLSSELRKTENSVHVGESPSNLKW